MNEVRGEINVKTSATASEVGLLFIIIYHFLSLLPILPFSLFSSSPLCCGHFFPRSWTRDCNARHKGKKRGAFFFFFGGSLEKRQRAKSSHTAEGMTSGAAALNEKYIFALKYGEFAHTQKKKIFFCDYAFYSSKETREVLCGANKLPLSRRRLWCMRLAKRVCALPFPF